MYLRTYIHQMGGIGEGTGGEEREGRGVEGGGGGGGIDNKTKISRGHQ